MSGWLLRQRRSHSLFSFVFSCRWKSDAVAMTTGGSKVRESVSWRDTKKGTGKWRRVQLLRFDIVSNERHDESSTTLLSTIYVRVHLWCSRNVKVSNSTSLLYRLLNDSTRQLSIWKKEDVESQQVYRLLLHIHPSSIYRTCAHPRLWSRRTGAQLIRLGRCWSSASLWKKKFEEETRLFLWQTLPYF